MVLINVPYVKRRKNKDGSSRWYWVRPGFDVVTLSDDEEARINKAVDLNARAKGGKLAPKEAPELDPAKNPAMLEHWIRQYLGSDEFAKLADNTKDGWRREAEKLSRAHPRQPMDGVTEQFVRLYLHPIPTPGVKALAKQSIRAIMAYAVMAGAITSNPTVGIRIKGIHRRDRVWSHDEIETFLAEAKPMIQAGFAIALHTGQRIRDVLAMTWAEYDGEFISVTQHKSKKKIGVYCHSDLRARLDELKKIRKGTRIVAHDDGHEVTYNSWAYNFRERRIKVGIVDAVTHDLRRTAAVLLKEAGNDIRDIAAVTGHSPQAVQVLCDHYLPHTRAQSKAAVQRLEEFQRGKK